MKKKRQLLLSDFFFFYTIASVCISVSPFEQNNEKVLVYGWGHSVQLKVIKIYAHHVYPNLCGE